MWTPIVTTLGLAVGGIALLLRDTDIAEGKAIEEAQACLRELAKLKDTKGRLVSIRNEKSDVLLEGRVHRVDLEEAIIDVRDPVKSNDDSVEWPTAAGTHKDLKVWVPKPGHRVTFLDEAQA